MEYKVPQANAREYLLRVRKELIENNPFKALSLCEDFLSDEHAQMWVNLAIERLEKEIKGNGIVNEL